MLHTVVTGELHEVRCGCCGQSERLPVGTAPALAGWGTVEGQDGRPLLLCPCCCWSCHRAEQWVNEDLALERMVVGGQEVRRRRLHWFSV